MLLVCTDMSTDLQEVWEAAAKDPVMCGICIRIQKKGVPVTCARAGALAQIPSAKLVAEVGDWQRQRQRLRLLLVYGTIRTTKTSRTTQTDPKQQEQPEQVVRTTEQPEQLH